MSIDGIRLRNFRGFRDAKIKLKPLTVLLGPNSAGKSAFGHALAAMTHVHRYYASTPQASLTPHPNDVGSWPVDLGQTNDLRTVGCEGPVQIGLQTADGVIELGFGGLAYTPDLILTYILFPSGEQSTGRRPSQMPLLEASVDQTSAVVPIEGQFAAILGGSTAGSTVELRRINEIQWQEGQTSATFILDGLIPRAVQHTSGTSRQLSLTAQVDLSELFKTLTYLRANRERPLRGYPDSLGKYQPIGYSGESAASILHRNGNDKVTYLVPPTIPNNVTEAKQADYQWKEEQTSLRDGLGRWLTRLEMATAVQTVQSGPDNSVKVRVALNGQSPHDITEVGFGVSQIIPVLVAGLRQPKDSWFIVDLPEAHLHPRPQGVIADFFCSLARSGRSALVETHSEMFFHRLRLRAAMDPYLMENTAVYFIDRSIDGSCREPRLVDLGYEGELCWPEGFLQEAWETETQISAVREAQRLARG